MNAAVPTSSPPAPRPASLWPLARSIAAGAGLVVLFTYPTIPRLTSVGRLDTGDGRLSIWNVGWIAHALTTDPRTLLNANIFWPHTGTLMYSEPNFVAGLLGTPWFAATGSAIAALNGAAATALLLTFVLTAALVRRLTGSEGAGLVAAVAFTFCPYIHARTAHIQLLMTFVFPLVFLTYHWMAERPSIRRGLALGAALAIGSLACSYYGMFAGCALGVVALGFAQKSRRYWLALAAALGVVAAVLTPLYLTFAHYRDLSGAPYVMRDPDEAWQYAADLASYLTSSATAHAWWLGALTRHQPWFDVLFPGIGLTVLAAIGVAVMRPTPAERRIRWTYLAVAVLACWASLGPKAGLYEALQTFLPGMSFLRVASRFGILVTFALAVLAGFGAAWIGRRRPWALAVIGVLIACELGVKSSEWGWPSWPLREALTVPQAYQVLATKPRGGLAEFEFPYERRNFHNHTWAMFWSTYHWQPIVNGYTDLIPGDFEKIALPINGFPDPASFEIMKTFQVRYVLWHTDAYKGETRRVITERLQKYPEYLRPLVLDERAWLYEIVAWPPPTPALSAPQ